ncbi:hypothetical protein F5Y16DRAFT_282112 [Xylariaceae sp. FL0255]|nr:hypothetical protein F5Y16DRAFT_282112 [Xylariaceae sp. FL0255]
MLAYGTAPKFTVVRTGILTWPWLITGGCRDVTQGKPKFSKKRQSRRGTKECGRCCSNDNVGARSRTGGSKRAGSKRDKNGTVNLEKNGGVLASSPVLLSSFLQRNPSIRTKCGNARTPRSGDVLLLNCERCNDVLVRVLNGFQAPERPAIFDRSYYSKPASSCNLEQIRSCSVFGFVDAAVADAMRVTDLPLLFEIPAWSPGAYYRSPISSLIRLSDDHLLQPQKGTNLPQLGLNMPGPEIWRYCRYDTTRFVALPIFPDSSSYTSPRKAVFVVAKMAEGCLNCTCRFESSLVQCCQFSAPALSPL